MARHDSDERIGRPMSHGRLTVGEVTPALSASSVEGRTVQIPPTSDGGRWKLLSFVRYASCPMCNLRMRELAIGLPRLQAAGVDVLLFVHSPRERIERFVPPMLLPHTVADPARVWYRSYSVSPSWLRMLWSVILPSFYWAWLKAMVYGYWGGWIDGPFTTMPADFLVSPDGRLRIAHYGTHIGDHVGVDDVLTMVNDRGVTVISET